LNPLIAGLNFIPEERVNDGCRAFFSQKTDRARLLRKNPVAIDGGQVSVEIGAFLDCPEYFGVRYPLIADLDISGWRSKNPGQPRAVFAPFPLFHLVDPAGLRWLKARVALYRTASGMLRSRVS
jgi:hypothetical protein